MHSIKTRFSDVPIALVIFRENLEDLYIGKEKRTPRGAEATAVFTRAGCKRIAEFAFDFARCHGRKKVTIVHKANILKETHGLFLKVARQVAKRYPDVPCEDLIADNFMMQLVRNPQNFSFVLTPNFLGDLISDLAAGLVGGLGIAPGANIGKKYAVFEAVHGTADDIAGKGVANPLSLLLSACMMLNYIGESSADKRVREAIARTLTDGIYTGDVRREGSVGTDAFAQAIIARLKK